MHKVKIKLGPYEFEAEGDKDVVEAQFAQFIELVNKAPAAPANAPAGGPSGNVPPSADPTPPDELTAKTFKKVSGVLSLTGLPKGKSYAADALMVLLYGYKVLKGEERVLGGHLMQSAKQSGLKLDRVDRVLDAHRSYFIKAGARKGARYGLNNPGVEKAKEIMAKIYE